MVRIGLPEAIPSNVLRDFSADGVELVRLPDDLRQPVEVEFWIPPLFGWLATPMVPYIQGAKVIQSLMAGVDWILPVLPKGVILCDGRGLHDIPVAEWIVGAILSSLKRFPEFCDAQREHVWDGQSLQKKSDGNTAIEESELPYRILGDELVTKKVLIVGYGSIGMETERLLRPFGVEFLRVARTAREGVAGMEELDGLLPQADVVVLLVPLTPQTRGLMNEKNLARIKPGALLVNAARGPVVDTAALVERLHSGELRAVLDVMDPEPLPQDHPLWSAPNCFITPHVAGSVAGFAPRAYRFAAQQVRRYLAGEPLENQVNEAGY